MIEVYDGTFTTVDAPTPLMLEGRVQIMVSGNVKDVFATEVSYLVRFYGLVVGQARMNWRGAVVRDKDSDGTFALGVEFVEEFEVRKGKMDEMVRDGIGMKFVGHGSVSQYLSFAMVEQICGALDVLSWNMMLARDEGFEVDGY